MDSVRVPFEVSTAFIDTSSYTCNHIARIAHGTDGTDGTDAPDTARGRSWGMTLIFFLPKWSGGCRTWAKMSLYGGLALLLIIRGNHL